MCCKAGGVWSEVKLVGDLIGRSNPPIRLTSSSMTDQSECFFIMAETAGEILSVFHPWHRPAPLILMIITLQVGKLLHLFIYSHISHTEVSCQFWVGLWKSQTPSPYIIVLITAGIPSVFHQCFILSILTRQ